MYCWSSCGTITFVHCYSGWWLAASAYRQVVGGWSGRGHQEERRMHVNHRHRHDSAWAGRSCQSAYILTMHYHYLPVSWICARGPAWGISLLKRWTTSTPEICQTSGIYTWVDVIYAPAGQEHILQLNVAVNSQVLDLGREPQPRGKVSHM